MKRSIVRMCSLVLMAATGLLSTGAECQACSVPVFRYALERWPADYYQVVVYHRGELTAEQKEIVDLLGEEGLAGETFTNVFGVTCDLDAKEPKKELLELWKEQEKKAGALPWVVVRYPWQTRIPVPAWSGPLTNANILALMDSPIRKDIAQRIVSGETAVWLLLESGNKEKDDAAFKLVKEQLEIAEKEIQPPEIDPADVAMGYTSAEPGSLRIKFSVVRLSREASDEKMLVEFLLGTEPDLRDFNEPMVFPVFGRGRVLFALVGPGINEDNIAEALFILTGPCTCTIKAQNPGTDIVMGVDWDQLIYPEIEEKPLPQLTGLGGIAPSESDSSGKPSEPDSAAGSMETKSDSGANESVPDQAKETTSTDAPVIPKDEADASKAEESDSTSSAKPEGDIEAASHSVTATESDPGAAQPMSSSNVSKTVTTEPVTASSALIRNVLIVTGLGVVIVVAGSIFLIRKS